MSLQAARIDAHRASKGALRFECPEPSPAIILLPLLPTTTIGFRVSGCNSNYHNRV